MTGLAGQIILGPEQLGAFPVSNSVNHLVGTTETLIEKPSGSTAQSLILVADNGDFRFRVKDTTSGLPAAFAPAASLTNGAGAVGLREGGRIILSAPSALTIKGYVNAGGGDPVLTYWWV